MIIKKSGSSNPVSVSLSTITDVDATNKTDGYVLTYDATTGKFKSKGLPVGTGSGATNLDGLTDVDVTTASPKEGDTLIFKGGVWVAGDSTRTINSKIAFAQSPTTRTALVTFIDDDAKAQVLTRVQPLIQSKSIPWALAVPASDILPTNGRSLTNAEVLNFQNTFNCEIVAHTYTHPNLTTLTTTQLETELGEAKKVLSSRGYNIRGVAYPYGANNALVRKIAAKYYDYGVNTLGHTNIYPTKTFQIERVSLGAYTDGNNSLAYYKGKVDEAVANKGWVIFVSHSWNAEHDDAQQQIISDLIDYIKSLSISIVNPSVGWEMFGNIVEVEDKVRITRSGEVIVDNSTEYKTFRDNSHAPDALLTTYTTQTITIAEYGNVNKGTLPAAGLLETKRSPNSDLQFSTQILYGLNGSIYTRKAIAYNDATWAAWKTVFAG